MNLRAMFQPRQLLSAIVALLPAVAALAPADVAAQGVGNDIVVMKPAVAGQPPRTMQGVLITGMQGNRVMVRDASGEVGYDVAQVQQINKAAPPEFAQAQK